jgi:hypothetical protein
MLDNAITCQRQIHRLEKVLGQILLMVHKKGDPTYAEPPKLLILVLV